MSFSTLNTKPAALPKPPTAESEVARLAEHRRLSDLTAQEAVEGLRRLAARKKAAREAPPLPDAHSLRGQAKSGLGNLVPRSTRMHDANR
jgi:hypothetical protein